MRAPCNLPGSAARKCLRSVLLIEFSNREIIADTSLLSATSAAFPICIFQLNRTVARIQSHSLPPKKALFATGKKGVRPCTQHLPTSFGGSQNIPRRHFILGAYYSHTHPCTVIHPSLFKNENYFASQTGLTAFSPNLSDCCNTLYFSLSVWLDHSLCPRI